VDVDADGCAEKMIESTTPAFAPPLLATDLEGILLPEIWIAVADATGIPELRMTTRDVADYDQLMQMRLSVLRRYGVRLADIQAVIGRLDLLPGAEHLLGEVRALAPLVIVTDSFYEFVNPVLHKLGFATLFAHTLWTDGDGMLAGYRLRVEHSKRQALRAFRELGFRTMAVGDSYNDIAMLLEADQGVLFRPPDNVRSEYPNIPAVHAFDELLRLVRAHVTADSPRAA